jgi:hypothetical protein
MATPGDQVFFSHRDTVVDCILALFNVNQGVPLVLMFCLLIGPDFFDHQEEIIQSSGWKMAAYS